VLENNSTETTSVADVLRRYGAYALATGGASPHQLKTLSRLTACRTRAMGGHRWQCGGCGHQHFRYHSCRNRHCPTCSGAARSNWLEKMLDGKLPVGYVHVVFTLPHELLPLLLANPWATYTLLFRSAWKALSRPAAKKFGIQMAAVMVLHTWGQRLGAHVHVHCLIPLGGLLRDQSRWLSIDDADVLLETATLADRFRALYLRGLVKLHQKHELKLTGELAPLAEASAFDAWLAPLARKGWIVNVQPPPEHSAGPEAALKYLAAYVAGAAIGNGRIVRDDGRRVTFRVKDYRNGGQTITERLAGSEFVRRFLLHILPKRFRRVRYYGFLGGSEKNKKLARCRELLGVEEVERVEEVESPESSVQSQNEPAPDSSDPLAPTCPKCRAQPMEWVADILPTGAWCARRYDAFQRHFHAERALRAARQIAARPPP
jgi:hypothetical protein